MKINLLSFIITCILLQYSTSAAQTANESYYAKLKLLKDIKGKASPSFDAVTLSGKRVNLESLKGKTVVVNFWFVGCKPCEEEMPGLNQLVKEYRDSTNIVFLSFSRSGKSETKNFLAKNEFDYEAVSDAQSIAKLFNVSGYPSHFIIDNKGIVRYVSIGGNADIGKMLNVELKCVIGNTKSSMLNENGKIYTSGTNVYKNEIDEVLDAQEAVKLLVAGTHQAFRKYDKDGNEYILVKKK